MEGKAEGTAEYVDAAAALAQAQKKYNRGESELVQLN
jgi:hypothetical protein